MAAVSVSIQIINYNTFDLTCSCIESIIQHTQGIDYEIIVIDNASPSDNADLFKEKYPNIILVKSAENLGFARGHNLGLTYASGEYVLLLNSDTYFVEDCINPCLKRMQASPQVGALTCKLVYPNGTPQPVAGNFPKLSLVWRKIFRLDKLSSKDKLATTYYGDFIDYDKEALVPHIWGAFFFFRKEIVAQMPGRKLFDKYFMYQEDVHWCWNLKSLGYKILYYPATKIVHHVSGSQQTIKSPEEKYFQKILPNEFDFIKNTRGGWYAWLYYCSSIILHLSEPRAHSWNKASRYWRFLLGPKKVN